MKQTSLRAERIAMGVGFGALALLFGALGFQYIGGIKPCEMCHWQRWAHIAAAIVGIIGIMLAKDKARALAWAAVGLVTLSGLIGLYQSGMQWGLLPGPASCSGHRFVLGTNMVPDVQCDVVTWQLFGLSLAVYNALFSFLIAGAAGLGLVETRHA
jgi:disulfide bond formation protein DsbB